MFVSGADPDFTNLYPSRFVPIAALFGNRRCVRAISLSEQGFPPGGLGQEVTRLIRETATGAGGTAVKLTASRVSLRVAQQANCHKAGHQVSR